MILVLQILGWITRGIVPPCQLVSGVMLCHCDKLRILNATGQRLALPTVKGLALATFVHDILNQVARAGRHDLGASVGTAEGSGEDFDCLCFFHGSNMAHFSDFCCINRYRLANPVGEPSTLVAVADPPGLSILYFMCFKVSLAH